MSPFFFLFRELLGATRMKSGLLFLGMTAAIFAFLAVFSCFFLVGTPTAVHSATSLGTITVYLSPKLSDQDVQTLYLKLRDRADVANVHFLFASEIASDQPGGAFRVRAANPAHAAALATTIGKLIGVRQVIVAPRGTTRLDLPRPVRIGLVLGLVMSGFLLLFIARAAFLDLLRGFSPQIVLMDLAGTHARTMQVPVIALGAVCGLIASIVLIAIVYVLHISALSPSGAILSTAPGLTDGGRVLASSLLSLLIGPVLGTLAGIYGASLIPRFRT